MTIERLFRVCCDLCGRAGPLCQTEAVAIHLATKQGWERRQPLDSPGRPAWVCPICQGPREERAA